jgi:hypothetical protein
MGPQLLHANELESSDFLISADVALKLVNELKIDEIFLLSPPFDNAVLCGFFIPDSLEDLTTGHDKPPLN